MRELGNNLVGGFGAETLDAAGELDEAAVRRAVIALIGGQLSCGRRPSHAAIRDLVGLLGGTPSPELSAAELRARGLRSDLDRHPFAS